MSPTLEKPAHVKYRREGEYGLVYDHENYGYEDATLLTVDERVIDVLEAVDGSPRELSALEAEFSPALVEAVREEGYLRAA